MPRKPRPEAPLSQVYVVRSERTALLKIGTTTDLPRRLNELSRLCKGAVTLVATLPGDAQLERHLHALCAADLVAGEWFRPSEHVLALVTLARDAARWADVVRADAASVTSIVAPPRPHWFAVEWRDVLPLCPCVRPATGLLYAAGNCPRCNGAGVLSRNTTNTPASEAA